MGASQAKLKYLKRYSKEQCKSYSLRLSYSHCQDVIDYFNKNGVQPTVMKAVRMLIESEKKEQ